MAAVLETKELVGIVQGIETDTFRSSDHPKPSQKQLEALCTWAPEHGEREKKTRVLLVSALGDKSLRAVISVNNGLLEIWRKLQDRYATNNATNRTSSKPALYSKKYVLGEDRREHIDPLDSIMSRLEVLVMKLDDYMKVAILISILIEEKELENVFFALKTQESQNLSLVSSRVCEEPDVRKESTVTKNQRHLGAMTKNREAQT